MTSEQLSRVAEACRGQAGDFDGPERRLLLKIANLFEQMTPTARLRRAVAADRCW